MRGRRRPKFDVASTARRRTSTSSRAPPPARPEEARGADVKPEQPRRLEEVRRARRRARTACRRAQRALLVTEIQGLERLFERRRRTRPIARSSTRRLAEAYVELESRRLPRQDRRPTSSATTPRRRTRRRPASSADAGQPGREDRQGRAQEGDRATTRIDRTNDYPNYATARRGPLLPRVRVRAGERPQERAHGLLRAHPEGAQTRSSSRTPTSRSASSSSTRRRAIPSKWDLAAQAYKEVIKYPPPDEQGVRLRAATSSATSSGTRASYDEGAQRVQEDHRVRRSVHRQLPNATQLADSRASRHHPGLRRSRATRRRPTTSSSRLAATQGGERARRSR